MSRQEPGRLAELCATVLVGLAVALTVVFVALYLLEQDPYLGYVSDPEFARRLVFLVLPGLACAVAVLALLLVRSTRVSAISWAAVTASLVVIVITFWMPLHAALAGAT